MGQAEYRRAEWVIQYYDDLCWSTLMEKSIRSKFVHYAYVTMRPRSLTVAVVSLRKYLVNRQMSPNRHPGIHVSVRLLNLVTGEVLPAEALGIDFTHN